MCDSSITQSRHYQKPWGTTWFKSAFPHKHVYYSFSQSVRMLGLLQNISYSIFYPWEHMNIVFNTTSTQTWVCLNCVELYQVYWHQTAGRHSAKVCSPKSKSFLYSWPCQDFPKFLKPHTLCNRRLHLDAMRLFEFKMLPISVEYYQ